MLAKILVSKLLTKRQEKVTQLFPNYQHHPDILVLEAPEKLGIEQTKLIKEHLQFKPLSLDGKIVIIEDASSLSREAQNSLLKTLEELPEKAQIILGVSSENDLLPTILSRCEVVILNEVKDPSRMREDHSDIEKLVNSSLEERFEYIEKLKDKKGFLQELLVYWQNQLQTSGQGLTNIQMANFLKELLQAEEWMDANVNPRGILEYLMLVMPRVED